MNAEQATKTAGLRDSTGLAPYASYEAVQKIIKLVADGEIQGPISRAQLAERGMSPFNQLVITQAMRTMDLIDVDGRPTDRLQRAILDDRHRREEIKEWALDFYAAVLQLARQDASALEIQDEFANFRYRGSTLKKAMAFYLACAADVDLAVSSKFAVVGQAPRAASRQHRYGRPNGPGPQDLSTAWAGHARSAPSAAAGAGGEFSGTQTAGEKAVIDLGECGQITVFADVRWFQLPSQDSARLQDLVRDLQTFADELRSHQLSGA